MEARYPMGWEKEQMYQALPESLPTSHLSDRLLDIAGRKSDVALALKILHSPSARMQE